MLTWILRIIVGDVAGARFDSVAANGVGTFNYATGDAYPTTSSLAGSGAVHLYEKSAATGLWMASGSVKAPNAGQGDGFGGAVAVSGLAVLVGADLEGSAAASPAYNLAAGEEVPQNNDAPSSGAAYLYGLVTSRCTATFVGHSDHTDDGAGAGSESSSSDESKSTAIAGGFGTYGGQVVAVMCNAGYVGSSHTTCTSSGTFEPTIRCMKVPGLPSEEPQQPNTSPSPTTAPSIDVVGRVTGKTADSEAATTTAPGALGKKGKTHGKTAHGADLDDSDGDGAHGEGDVARVQSSQKKGSKKKKKTADPARKAKKKHTKTAGKKTARKKAATTNARSLAKWVQRLGIEDVYQPVIVVTVGLCTVLVVFGVARSIGARVAPAGAGGEAAQISEYAGAMAIESTASDAEADDHDALSEYAGLMPFGCGMDERTPIMHSN